jgi:dihydroxy-acid dehydratase
METEELLRSYPADGCVLMGGCDKTTPALVMGAISMGLPAIYMPAGPMLRGNWHGQVLGSGSDSRKYWAELRAGTITERDWEEIEEGIARSPGHCMTMGTASTMTSAVEALGLTLPGAASIPAADSHHAKMATATGKRAVELVWEDATPKRLLSASSFDNAVTCVVACGGSTNSVIHLIAMARRAGVPLDLDRFEAISKKTPVIANLRPSGKFLMEDFYYAGGLPALLGSIRDLLDLNAKTVSGRTLGENLEGAKIYNPEVILPRAKPVLPSGGLAILRGNLAPDGAVVKPAATEKRLWKHKGRAVVFEDYNDLQARIDDPALDVDADCVIVLKNAGPVGAPGMPEWEVPIPKKLLQQGVRDMVRVSDARMSGTAFGCCVLHVAPESFIGGPLALVKDGDLIELDIERRRLQLLIDDAEMMKRKRAWKAPARRFERGYGALFSQHIRQANEGCDFDFLEGTAPTADPEIH